MGPPPGWGGGAKTLLRPPLLPSSAPLLPLSDVKMNYDSYSTVRGGGVIYIYIYIAEVKEDCTGMDAAFSFFFFSISFPPPPRRGPGLLNLVTYLCAFFGL